MVEAETYPVSVQHAAVVVGSLLLHGRELQTHSARAGQNGNSNRNGPPKLVVTRITR